MAGLAQELEVINPANPAAVFHFDDMVDLQVFRFRALGAFLPVGLRHESIQVWSLVRNHLGGAVDQIGASVVVESPGAFHLLAASTGAKIPVTLKHAVDIAVVAATGIGVVLASIFEHLNHLMPHCDAVNFAYAKFNNGIHPPMGLASRFQVLENLPASFAASTGLWVAVIDGNCIAPVVFLAGFKHLHSAPPLTANRAFVLRGHDVRLRDCCAFIFGKFVLK